jgi:hypothetical protein
MSPSNVERSSCAIHEAQEPAALGAVLDLDPVRHDQSAVWLQGDGQPATPLSRQKPAAGIDGWNRVE